MWLDKRQLDKKELEYASDYFKKAFIPRFIKENKDKAFLRFIFKTIEKPLAIYKLDMMEYSNYGTLSKLNPNFFCGYLIHELEIPADGFWFAKGDNNTYNNYFCIGSFKDGRVVFSKSFGFDTAGFGKAVSFYLKCLGVENLLLDIVVI